MQMCQMVRTCRTGSHWVPRKARPHKTCDSPTSLPSTACRAVHRSAAHTCFTAVSMASPWSPSCPPLTTAHTANIAAFRNCHSGEVMCAAANGTTACRVAPPLTWWTPPPTQHQRTNNSDPRTESWPARTVATVWCQTATQPHVPTPAAPSSATRCSRRHCPTLPPPLHLSGQPTGTQQLILNVYPGRADLTICDAHWF